MKKQFSIKVDNFTGYSYILDGKEIIARSNSDRDAGRIADALNNAARIASLEAALKQTLEALMRITDGAVPVYELGEEHGMSARSEIDHRDLKFARKAIAKAKGAK